MRTRKEIEEAIIKLKERFDTDWLFKHTLRFSMHGAIMGLLYALGERELQDVLEDKTDSFINMTIRQQEKQEKVLGAV